MSESNETREQWLQRGLCELRALAKDKLEKPTDQRIQVAVGFPKGCKRGTVGQCFHAECTEDGTYHIFIHPTLGDAVRVLDTLLHELLHAVVGLEAKHAKPFRDAARAVGLAGKPTATYAEEGSELHEKLTKLSERLGPYPHSPMTKVKQSNRPAAGGWVRYESVNEPKYILRISPRALEDHGAPTDPWGDGTVESDAP